jgi:hypothetical protein
MERRRCPNQATAILQRIEAGDMPCDAASPQARVELFLRWMQEGMTL